MTTIGIDTSMAHTSACVIREDGRAFSTVPPSAARLFEPPGHSAELLPTLDALLIESETDWADVGSIAVGVGPGTFTGLRIGVASARALGQALGIGLRPVSSLQSLAAGCASILGPDRPVLALIDARRKEVFAGLYRSPAGVDRTPAAEWPPFVVRPEELLSRIGGLAQRPLAVGDWALESRSMLETAGAEVSPDDSGVHAVNATHVCRLALEVEPVDPDQVEPVYLRLPDAEINRRKAG